jgi:DivIVA domain-containing protein
MAFTPEEVENKEFLTTMRGYDKEEVDAFLRAVASDYREAIRQARDENVIKQLRDGLVELQKVVAGLLDQLEES